MNKQTIVKNDDFDKIDYSKTSDKLKAVLKPEPYTLVKSTNIVSDSKQLLVRIPKKIQEQYGIKKKDKMNFKLTVNNPENASENTIEITITRCDE